MHTPILSASVFHGSGRQLNCQAHVVLTTFETLIASQDSLCSESWHRLVVDEAHGVRKAPQSKDGPYEEKQNCRAAVNEGGDCLGIHGHPDHESTEGSIHFC